MTNEQAMHMLKAKLECLKRETSGTDFDCNNSNCDDCSLNYEQGNMGGQKEALDLAIKALEQQSCTDPLNVLTEVRDSLKALPSAQPDLIIDIQNGIKATNSNDAYSCGMRNGMRWCISLIDGKEPLYENCPSSQPEIIRCKDCKKREYCRTTNTSWAVVPSDDWFCADAERRTDE